MAADESVVAALAATDLFRSLDRKALSRVAAEASIVHHRVGTELAREGQGGVGFHLIMAGEA